MLFRELNTQFMQNISDISLESGEKGAITIDNNKSEFLVILEQVVKALSMEFMPTRAVQLCYLSAARLELNPANAADCTVLGVAIVLVAAQSVYSLSHHRQS